MQNSALLTLTVFHFLPLRFQDFAHCVVRLCQHLLGMTMAMAAMFHIDIFGVCLEIIVLNVSHLR